MAAAVALAAGAVAQGTRHKHKHKHKHKHLIILLRNLIHLQTSHTHSTRGSVIITTYNPKWTRLQTAGTIELGVLRFDDATRLLLQTCQMEKKLWMESFDDARKIVRT
jgi:hypothetical protein